MTVRVRRALAALLLLTLSLPVAGRTAAQGDARDYWPTAGWRTADPAELGIDPAALTEVDTRVPSEPPDLSALLVVRDGYLVFEGSYNGHEPDEPINTRSVTKSVTSTLIGIALAEGALESLDQTVGELIPDRIPAGADPRVADLTLEQLLSMTIGLLWHVGG